jgi:hypothetical protein
MGIDGHELSPTFPLCARAPFFPLYVHSRLVTTALDVVAGKEM